MRKAKQQAIIKIRDITNEEKVDLISKLKKKLEKKQKQKQKQKQKPVKTTLELSIDTPEPTKYQSVYFNELMEDVSVFDPKHKSYPQTAFNGMPK